ARADDADVGLQTFRHGFSLAPGFRWRHIVPSPACSRTRVYPSSAAFINWPKSETSDFGWRDREGARNMKALQVTPSPTLPRKREREQTELGARTDPITSPTGRVSRMIRALARVRRRARAQPLHHDRNERENPQRHKRAEKLRRERRLHVELEPAIGASR